MRYLKAEIGTVYPWGEKQLTLFSFGEDGDLGQLVTVCFTSGKTRYELSLVDVDLQRHSLLGNPVQITEKRGQSFYLGKKVRTVSGKYLGVVTDIGFLEESGRIQEFVVAKMVFGVEYERRHIARTAVVKVSRRLIVVEDAWVREYMKEKGRSMRWVSRPVSACMRWIMRQP